MTAAEDLQRDLELSATETDAAAAAATENQKNLHTAMPGIIQSFDPKTQTATVQPAIRRIWVDDGPVDLPPCLDVPVHFPRGGGFRLTFPVAAGDECLLVFGERAIDNWFANGGTQDPSEFRMHDLSDAFAFVGFSSLQSVIENLATDAVELRTDDGATRVRLEKDLVTLGQMEAAVAACRADIMNRIITLLESHTHPVAGVQTGSGAVVTGPSPTLTDLPDPSASNVKVS